MMTRQQLIRRLEEERKALDEFLKAANREISHRQGMIAMLVELIKETEQGPAEQEAETGQGE